jgi:ketosteroid isomerase-like protein
MSRENVELVRSGYEAFGQEEFDRMFAWLDQEIVWDVSRRLIDPDVFHGHEGVREFLRRQGEVWSHQRIEPEEFIAIGEDVVVVPIRFVSTGRERDRHRCQGRLGVGDPRRPGRARDRVSKQGRGAGSRR